MKKVVLTGPESTGKSTLALALSKHFGCPFVPEVARAYLEEQEGFYEEPDLVKIAKRQFETETEVAKFASELLICDTDLLTIQIWGEVVYERSDPWIKAKNLENQPDLYLLCAADLPWEADPLRENPDDREALFSLYQQALEAQKTPYTLIQGLEENRLQLAIQAIDKLL